MAPQSSMPGAPGPVSIAPPSTPGGQYFGKYQILGELGRGGMGVVYSAKQLDLDRIVALKVLVQGQFANKEQVERFFQEARSAAKLNHPNIAPIFDLGEVNGQYYFTMEYFDGINLEQAIAKQPMEPRVAALAALSIARGLHFAHENGIVHRDIKPSNVLIKSRGTLSGAGAAQLPAASRINWDEADIKVVDFGLARAVGKEDAAPRLTASHALMGTPFYMSPEQARGDTDSVDARSDVYALGAVLYEMLTGIPPYADKQFHEVIRETADPLRPAAPPKMLNAKVDPVLDIICQNAMRKDMRRRYQSAREMALDLEKYLRGDRISAKPLGFFERRGWSRMRVAATFLLPIALATSAGAWYRQKQIAEAKPIEISWLQAHANVGKMATVEMPVLKTAIQDGGTALVAKPGDKTAFEAIVPAELYGAFPEGFDKTEGYWMKLLKVTGKIELNDGKPILRLSGADRVEVIRSLRGKERGEGALTHNTTLTPSADNLILWTEASDHVGEDRTVEGTIVNARDASSAKFLNFNAAKDGPVFYLTCFEASWEDFPDGFEKLYVGKKVWVAGKIDSYKGNPRMYLNHPDQIKIVGEGETAEAARPSKENLIDFKKAIDNVGKAVTVEGTIVSAVRRESQTFLNFSGSTDKTGFVAVVFTTAYSRFPDGFETIYQGKKVWIAGTIELYRGQPRIVVADPSQIKVDENE